VSNARKPSAGSNGVERRALRAVVWAVVLAALFVAGTFVTPLLPQGGAAGLLRVAYAPLCHQMPERSVAIGGGTQAVCARCSGLYLGGLIGLAAAALMLSRGRLRPRRWWLVAALTPSVIDLLLPWLGLPNLANLPRLLLAIPAGGVAALFLAMGIADLFSRHAVPARQRHYTNSNSRTLEETHG
jgi:uncharacterized membrane protein